MDKFTLHRHHSWRHGWRNPEGWNGPILEFIDSANEVVHTATAGQSSDPLVAYFSLTEAEVALIQDAGARSACLTDASRTLHARFTVVRLDH